MLVTSIQHRASRIKYFQSSPSPDKTDQFNGVAFTEDGCLPSGALDDLSVKFRNDGDLIIAELLHNGPEIGRILQFSGLSVERDLHPFVIFRQSILDYFPEKCKQIERALLQKTYTIKFIFFFD
jgi:hypothetical protein